MPGPGGLSQNMIKFRDKVNPLSAPGQRLAPAAHRFEQSPALQPKRERPDALRSGWR